MAICLPAGLPWPCVTSPEAMAVFPSRSSNSPYVAYCLASCAVPPSKLLQMSNSSPCLPPAFFPGTLQGSPSPADPGNPVTFPRINLSPPGWPWLCCIPPRGTALLSSSWLPAPFPSLSMFAGTRRAAAWSHGTGGLQYAPASLALPCGKPHPDLFEPRLAFPNSTGYG